MYCIFSAPVYNGEHHVTPASWSYADNDQSKKDQGPTAVVDEVEQVDEEVHKERKVKVIDLSKGPPDYKESVEQAGQARKKLMLEVRAKFLFLFFCIWTSDIAISFKSLEINLYQMFAEVWDGHLQQ